MSDARLKTLEELAADLPSSERDVLATLVFVLSERAGQAPVNPDDTANRALLIAERLVRLSRSIREGDPVSGAETIGALLGLAGALVAMAAGIAARDEAEGRA